MVLIGQDLLLETRDMVDPAEDSPSMLDQGETEIMIDHGQIQGRQHNLHNLCLGVLDVDVELVIKSELRRSYRNWIQRRFMRYLLKNLLLLLYIFVAKML